MLPAQDQQIDCSHNYSALLNDIRDICARHDQLKPVIAGDFNADLVSNAHGAVKSELLSFLSESGLQSAYDLYPNVTFASYECSSMRHVSLLNYVFVTDIRDVIDINGRAGINLL
jgi:hypothetical protein